MNKYAFFIFILILQQRIIYSQEYPCSMIPDSLKENADMVVREYTKEIELFSYTRCTMRVRSVYTILNEDGEESAALNIPYDKNSSVSVRQITIYDAAGEKIKNIKLSDITDAPAFASFELFSEQRSKYYEPGYGSYPYTIVYEYEIDLANIISFGSWRPFSYYNVSVQDARLVFIRPSNIKINKKEVLINEKASEKHKDVVRTTWEVSNIPAMVPEPFSAGVIEKIPGVYLMPDSLIYFDYKGSARNWSEYGKWVYSLYKGRSDISEAEKPKIDILLKDMPDTIERMKALYRYMQENTRYVAITLGAGGYQPFDAKSVFETGYGDCKALSNYMHSLLKYIGITSYSALVASGKDAMSVYKDFPNFQQLNHVILCVPFRKDTIWLECTDQEAPFGFLGYSTDDRDVLLLTAEGGRFAHTSKYGGAENVRISNSVFSINASGSAGCTRETTWKGLQYADHEGFLNSKYDEQKKWLYDNTSLPSLQITDFVVKGEKDKIPSLSVKEAAESRNYCSFSGQYMVLPLNLINAQKPIKKMLKPRFSDVQISRSFIDYDTITFVIPDTYIFESVPAEVNINTSFGTYSSSVTGTGNKIVFARKFSVKGGRYKPSEYKDLYDFILAISNADKAKMILKKKT